MLKKAPAASAPPEVSQRFMDLWDAFIDSLPADGLDEPLCCPIEELQRCEEARAAIARYVASLERVARQTEIGG